MDEIFDQLPPASQPEKEESIVEKLRRLGASASSEFIELFDKFVAGEMAKSMEIKDGNLADTTRANLTATLTIAKMKLELGLTESGLEDLDDILSQVYYAEDYSELGGEANRLINSLSNTEQPES